MKETILIKQSPAIQTAHLYEHLFCSAVDKLFFENGLFPYVDYSLTGNMHQTGVIYVKLETYTHEADELADRVGAIKIDISDDALSVAASQLLAENEHAYVVTGVQDVKNRLALLDELPWLNIDSIDTIDTKGVRRQANPFYIDTTHPLPAKKMSLMVNVDPTLMQEHRYLLPLVRSVCFLISETYETVLSDKYGIYSLGGKFLNSGNTVGYESVFNIADGHEISKEDVLELVSETIKYVANNGGFERLAKALQTLSYGNSSDLSPDALHNLTDTGILLGPDGWRKIASLDNINRIVESISLSVRIGRSTLSHK